MEDVVLKKSFETWDLKPNYKGVLLLQHIKQAKNDPLASINQLESANTTTRALTSVTMI